MRVALGVVTGLIVAAIGAPQAMAEIGKSSAAPGEWWLGFNIGAAATWGPEHEAYMQFDGPSRDKINFDDGFVFTGGLEVGYSFQEPTALIDRVEFNLDLSAISRTESESDADSMAFQIRDAIGQFFASLSSPDAVDISAEEEGTDVEARIAFKRTMADTGSHIILASLEPFFRYQDTSSDVTGHLLLANIPLEATFSRSDDIEASYYGIQVAVEFESPVSEAMNLIGRVSAGVYYVDSDITSRLHTVVNQNPPLVQEIDDSDDAIGGRFGAAFGVKVPLYHAGASFTIVATADYLTDAATIDHVDDTTSEFTEAGFDDRFDVGGKVGLVFPLK